MKKSIEDIRKKISALLRIGSKYSLVIFIAVFAGMAGYLVTRIGNLARQEPTQFELDERLKNVKTTKANDEAVESLQQLEGRNISIEALFDNGRTNPFED